MKYNLSIGLSLICASLIAIVYSQMGTIERQDKELECYRYFEKMNDTLITNFYGDPFMKKVVHEQEEWIRLSRIRDTNETMTQAYRRIEEERKHPIKFTLKKQSQ